MEIEDLDAYEDKLTEDEREQVYKTIQQKNLASTQEETDLIFEIYETCKELFGVALDFDFGGLETQLLPEDIDGLVDETRGTYLIESSPRKKIRTIQNLMKYVLENRKSEEEIDAYWIKEVESHFNDIYGETKSAA